VAAGLLLNLNVPPSGGEIRRCAGAGRRCVLTSTNSTKRSTLAAATILAGRRVGSIWSGTLAG